MIKRVNFTGRRRIPRDRIKVTVFDGRPRTFSADINLDQLPLSPHAAVYLEAMCAGSSLIQRFRCGEVSALRSICGESLDEIEGENVFFTLKVVDQTEQCGRILGIAENIRSEQSGKQIDAGRRGILPIEPLDIGEEIWRLEFREQDVFLLVNNKIGGLVDRARTDPLFYSIIYPEVIRRVLARAMGENVDINEADDRWPILWLRFGKSLHPDNQAPPTTGDAEEDKENWIDDVVEAFCKRHALCTKYMAGLSSADGSEP